MRDEQSQSQSTQRSVVLMHFQRKKAMLCLECAAGIEAIQTSPESAARSTDVLCGGTQVHYLELGAGGGLNGLLQLFPSKHFGGARDLHAPNQALSYMSLSVALRAVRAFSATIRSSML